LPTFLGRFKKGSRPFRKLFSEQLAKRREKGLKIARAYYAKTGIEEVPDSLETVQAWINPVHSNRQRDFLFKLYNNRLPVQTRLSHMVAGIDRSCTFCKTRRILPANEESFAHLFFDCEYTRYLIENFLREFIPEFAGKSEHEKRLFMLGCASLSNIQLPGIIVLARNMFQFILWEQKLTVKTPGWAGFATRLENEFNPVVMHTARNRLNLNRNDFILCRRWKQYRDERE